VFFFVFPIFALLPPFRDCRHSDFRVLLCLFEFHVREWPSFSFVVPSSCFQNVLPASPPPRGFLKQAIKAFLFVCQRNPDLRNARVGCPLLRSVSNTCVFPTLFPLLSLLQLDLRCFFDFDPQSFASHFFSFTIRQAPQSFCCPRCVFLIPLFNLRVDP